MTPPSRFAGAPLLVAALFLLLPAAGLRAAENSIPLLPPGAAEWRLTDAPRTFGPDNLYEEIDGEAELFLPYAFREMTAAGVARTGEAGPGWRVERFRHGDARDAFGVYSQHRFPDQETVRLDSSEAIVSGTSLDVFKGAYFVRIRSGAGGGTRDDLLALGRALLAVLPGSGAPPPETRAFGIPGVIPGTTVYQRRAILGDERLAPGYEAKVDADGPRTTLLLLLPADSPDGGAALRRLVSLPGWSKEGDDLYRADLARGTAWFRAEGSFALGVAGNPGKAAAVDLLRRMREALGPPGK